MKFFNKCSLLSLAFLTTFSAIASADNGGDRIVNQRLLQMLKNLQSTASETSSAQPVPTAVTSRGGTFNFTITVNRVSTNTEPMACSATIIHFNPSATYLEEASGKVIFNGNTGTCKISIPYIWKNADTLFKVSIETSINPYFPCTTTCVERPINRFSSHDLGDIALPANGATTPIADTFKL